MKINGFVFPFLSGLCGSLAGSFGKLTFQEEDSLNFNSQFLNYGVRVACFLLVLFFNQLMMKFMLNSFQLNGATLTVLFSFIFNSVSNIVVGYFLSGEMVSMKWMIGMVFIMIGVLFLSDGSSKQKTEEDLAKEKELEKKKK